MSLIKRIGHAAAAVKTTLFQRVTTNPNTNSNSNYLNMIYDRDYKKVRHYKDYREMMQDPQVKVGLSILNMFFLSRELRITAGGEEDIDKEAKQFIEDMLLHDMETPLRDVRKNIYTALPYAFSAQEMVYKLTDEGKIGLKGIYPIHRKTLDHEDTFKFDDNGELVALVQEFFMADSVDIPMEKVLLFSFDKEFDDPHGNSILDESYDNIYVKRKVLKWLALFLQKHASPFLVGILSRDSESYKKNMLTQLEDVAEGRTQMTIGKEDGVELLETANKGEAFFETIKYHDMMVFRRMFIGTLMMGQMDASGSYAQSESQVSVTRMLLDGVHEEIAAAIQKKIDEICGWNFLGAKAPKISFEKFEDKDILALLNALKPYVDSAVIDPDSAWFQDIIKVAVKELSGIELEDETATMEISDEHQDGLESNPW